MNKNRGSLTKEEAIYREQRKKRIKKTSKNRKSSIKQDQKKKDYFLP